VREAGWRYIPGIGLPALQFCDMPKEYAFHAKRIYDLYGSLMMLVFDFDDWIRKSGGLHILRVVAGN
jgi:hypothetical protein